MPHRHRGHCSIFTTHSHELPLKSWIPRSPYGVVLHVLGVQAWIEVDHGLEGPQVAVEEQQQQFELGVGGAERQALLQEPQALEHHGLVPCATQRASWRGRLRPRPISAGSGAARAENSPVSRQRSTYTWAAMRQYMSECCSSVFRAFFPAERTCGKSQHRCQNLSQC